MAICEKGRSLHGYLLQAKRPEKRGGLSVLMCWSDILKGLAGRLNLAFIDGGT